MSILDFLKRPSTNDEPISDSGRAHVSGFLQLEELNATLQGPEGLRIYDEMYRRDPDVRRAVRMACNPVISATWSIEAYGGDQAEPRDKEVADNLEWALGLGSQGATSPLRPRWRAHLAQAVPAFVRWGFCPFEITWTTAVRNGKTLVTPSRIGMRLPRTIYRWLLDEYHELQAIEQFLPLRGYVVIPREDLLYYRTDAEGDNYEGVSLLRACYKPWLIKDKIERLDAIAHEREAVGLPVVFPPRAGVTSPAVLEDLETKLQSLRAGQLAYLIMPGPEAATVKDQGGWTFKIEGFAGSTAGRDASKTLEYHRAGIAAAFIEEFMMLGQGGVGARATADVQEGPFNMACEALGAIPEAECNEILIPRWVELNYGKDCPLPSVSMSMAEEPLEDLRDYVSVLIATGVLEADGQLEDFMRDRADLPPADPVVRQEVDEKQAAQRRQAIDLANNPASHVPAPNASAAEEGGADEPGGTDKQVLESATTRRGVAKAAAASEAARPRDRTARLLSSLEQLRQARDSASAGPAQQRLTPGNDVRLLDTPNRSNGYSGDGTWPTTSGVAGVDGVPMPDVFNFLPYTEGWRCPCEKASCICATPDACTFVPTVDSSINIDENPKRRRRNAGDGTDANAPDAVDPPGGRTLARKDTTRRVQAPRRTLRPFEHGAHLDVIAHAFDNAREAFQDTGLEHVRASAAAAAKAALRGNSKPPVTDIPLEAALTGELARLHQLGYATVVSELHHQRIHQPLPIGLSHAPLPPHLRKAKAKKGKRHACGNCRMFNNGHCWGYGNYPVKPSQVCDSYSPQLSAKQLAEGESEPGASQGEASGSGARVRARLAAHAIATALWQAVSQARLQGVEDPAQLAAAGERAGDAALREAALAHSGGAIGTGRQAAATAAGSEVIGARYTAVLDQNTCGPCAEADDGVLRALADPVRLARKPPNPSCEGGGRCRCIEVFQLASESQLQH